MYRPWVSLRHGSRAISQRRSIADARPFGPGDLAILRSVRDQNKNPPILTRPLKPGRRIENHRGVVQHDAILGKRVRDLIQTEPPKSGKEGKSYRLHEVRLEEFVRLSRRLVTPIYPADAQLIVNLLDLHPYHTPDSASAPERLEILEAGTGHGALTLYLSRAIHAANPPLHLPSPSPDDKDAEQQEAYTTALAAYKPARQAVLHTLERHAKYSAHAEALVRTFRHGQYHRNVDFHVGDVTAWVRQALAERGGGPFLSHAFLDLPAQEDHLESVSEALKTDGCLMVFCPSVTQVLRCVEGAREGGLGLELENVVELGVNGGSAGREWDVRAVTVREPKEVEEEGDRSVGEEGSDADGDSEAAASGEEATPAADSKRSETGGKNTMVCRPKVGKRVVGGGFLGVWRKRRETLEGRWRGMSAL